MKAFVVLAAVVACASAQVLVSGINGIHGIQTINGIQGLTLAGGQLLTNQVISAPIAYSAPAVIAPAVTKTQYHAQDELGQASYGHAEPGQAHAAVRDALGNVRGSYAYINPDGKEIRVEYTAGHGGFQVASNALPVAPTGPEAPAPVALVAPTPVEDTAEVKEAKAAHAKAIEEAKARNAAAEKSDDGEAKSRRKRGILTAAPLAIAAPAAVTYSVPVAIAQPTIVAAPAVRQATLTKIVNNPLHAVSYRVD